MTHLLLSYFFPSFTHNLQLKLYIPLDKFTPPRYTVLRKRKSEEHPPVGGCSHAQRKEKSPPSVGLSSWKGMILLKKTLYSLMLNDEVVREVDALAHQLGTNRSALINQILAEYVHYTTPEQRIIEQLMRPTRELVPFFAPNASSLSLKSSLEYKYRPTVKYEVELYRGPGENIGELTVVFRTQSAALIQAMTEFFRLWKRIEDAHLYPLTGARIEYALYDGKFIRSLAAPERDCTSGELATALSEYIQLFDKLMKHYLTGRLDAHEVEAAYFSHMRSAGIHI